MKKTKKTILILLFIAIGIPLFKFSVTTTRELKGFYKYFKENIYMTPQEREEYIHRFDANRYFPNSKVVAFCNAVKDNDFSKADELIKGGVDVNYQGEGGITPTLWLLRKTDEGENKKKGLKYLLKQGINPIILYNTKSRGYQTVLHTVAQHEDSDYLKMLLESGNLKKEDVDFELPAGTLLKTALTQAYSSGRFVNFKMLLDYGANKNYIIKDKVKNGSILNRAASSNLWQYAYELLKRGADYKYALEHGLKRSAEDSYSAIDWIKLDGEDYQFLSWQFLKEKGVNLKLNLWPNQKYIQENGKWILYINEGLDFEGNRLEGKKDEWIKYEESSIYKNLSDEDRERIKQEKNTVYEIQRAVINGVK
jgi:hypothetical protein